LHDDEVARADAEIEPMQVGDDRDGLRP
jgi:hypothetical protein